MDSQARKHGPAHLRDRYLRMSSAVGAVVALVGALTLLPLLSLIAWPGEARSSAPQAALGLLCIAGGASLHARLRRRDGALTFSEGGVVVVLGWAAACLVSALSLMWTEGLSATHAVFEAVSGWTTTGLSVVDVQRVSHVTLLSRSLMQYAGGAGLAVIAVAAVIGPLGPALSSAEGRSEQLVPHFRKSAKLVLGIYGLASAAGVLGYAAAGMTWFDAVNHAFAAISTGGFSTRAASIGHWDSALVEGVSVALMCLGNLNFVTAYALLRGRVRDVARSSEVKLFAVLLGLGTAAIYVALAPSLSSPPGKALRVGLFEPVSALSTTGFSTVSYGAWPAMAVMVLLLLMLVGGGTGSTAGGVKQIRVCILLKALAAEIRRPLLPRGCVQTATLWTGERSVRLSTTGTTQASAFIMLYGLTYIAGVLVLTGHGYSLPDSLFEYASTLSTVGLSVGVTSPDAPPVVLWVQSVGMFLGRLEFAVVITSLAKIARDTLYATRQAAP